MLFKLAWKILTSIKFLVSLAVFGVLALVVYSNWQAIQNSPVGLMYPAIKQINLPQNPFAATPSVTPSPTPIPSQVSVHIKTAKGSVTYKAETATTTQARNLGLMYRTSLPPYNGMFFIFDEDIQYSFWMKNCEISLDMIFIDAQNQIVDVIRKVPPCKTIDPTQNNCPGYIPKTPYRYVLEVNGGSAQANDIAIGQAVSW